MIITIDVGSYYDWEPMEGKPSDADVLALKVKPADNGGWLQKVVREGATYTSVGMPEDEINNVMAHFERIGAPKSRERVVAWYLEEKISPHHAHTDHWTKISVHCEPEVEAFLNKHFDLV